MIRPYAALAPGDLVGVIAPAGPADAEQVDAIEPLLARFELRTRIYPGCRLKQGYLAGPDDQRLADLHAAFDDAEVAAVICSRGGFGSGRIVDRIDMQRIVRAHKPLVGFSDITALHGLWVRHGLVGIHGPMLSSNLVRPGNEDDAAALFELLRKGLRRGDVLAPPLQASPLHHGGVAEGRLSGGNLSLVAAMLGTPYAAPIEDTILFLEDINEEPYRVDRLLNQLRLSGVLQAARGFLIGSFTEGASPDGVLAQSLLPLGKPLLAGWPAGHAQPNRPLPLGARVQLQADAGRLVMLDDVIGV